MYNFKIGKTHKLTLTALFIAIGVILPYFTSHALGIQGTVLLPMHIPVFLAGFVCGGFYGAACGLITPVLAAFITKMPPVFPMLPIMMCELAAYGFASGLLHRKMRLPVAVSLPVSMICGRVAYAAAFYFLFLATKSAGEPLKALTVSAAVLTGLPGILLQLLLIPVLLKLISALFVRRGISSALDEPVKSEQGAFTGGVFTAATAKIKSGASTLFMLRDGEVVFETLGMGISPVLGLYETSPELMKGSAAVDKTVGKAAAMLFVLGGVSEVYGEIMSVSAREFLEKRGVKAAYGRCIEKISNRENNGICPMEKTVLDIDDLHEGYEALKNRLTELRKSS